MHVHQRMTQQKRVILEELQKVYTHPTADEVYEMVRKRIHNISLGTVYRNLEQLSASGKILKLELAGTQKRFDATIEPHHHIRCTSCGRVDDVERVEGNLEGIRCEANGYTVDAYRLEFFGRCQACLAKERTEVQQ